MLDGWRHEAQQGKSAVVGRMFSSCLHKQSGDGYCLLGMHEMSGTGSTRREFLLRTILDCVSHQVWSLQSWFFRFGGFGVQEVLLRVRSLADALTDGFTVSCCWRRVAAQFANIFDSRLTGIASGGNQHRPSLKDLHVRCSLDLTFQLIC